MWKSIPINPSEYYLIHGFDYIITVANAMKSCHVFKICRDGYLYGVPEEGFAMYRTLLPTEFIPPIDILFRLDSIDREIVEQYKDFYYFPSINWVMLPVFLLPDANNYKQVIIDNIWHVIDIRTGAPDFNVIELYKPESDKAIFLPILDNNMVGFNTAFMYTNPPIAINNIQDNPTIISVTSTKISQGRQFLYLVTDHGNFGMHIFRNLLNMNKGDNMDIWIYTRRDYPNLFIAEFKLYRKKNPLKDKQEEYNIYNKSYKFNIDILVQYMNLS